MFKFLKEKLKKAFSFLKKEVEETPAEAPAEKPVVEKKVEEKVEKPAPKAKEEKPKFAFFRKKLSEKQFERFWDEFEFDLIELNVALPVIEKLREETREIVGKPFRGKVEEFLKEEFRKAFASVILQASPQELLERIKSKKPFVILFVGVNGVGKTTTIAKFAKWLMDHGFKVVLAASDTFRAASIEQLEEHAKRLGVKVIKQKYGADAAAVAYDAVEYAKAHGIDVVLVDSAGRQHTNVNLMEELRKIKRVSNADATILVVDALTGNDAVNQAQEFNNNVGIDYIVLTKADVDEKGGAILSVSYVTRKPIIFLGTGQSYDDLKPFDKAEILARLFE